MKPTDLYLLPVLLAVLVATLLITPSDGQGASTYNHQMLRSNNTNPIIAYSSKVEVMKQAKPVKTMVVPEVMKVGTTEEPAKLEPSTVSGEGTTVEQGIAEESVTVQAEDGVNEEDSSEEEDKEVVDENSATEEVDETEKE